MDRHEKVVVLVTPEITKHSEETIYAGKLPELALTAYGRTPEQAAQAVKDLFRKFVDEHRKLGKLKERLDQSGVTWWWISEYPAEGIAVEDTTKSRSWIRAGYAAEVETPLAA